MIPWFDQPVEPVRCPLTASGLRCAELRESDQMPRPRFARLPVEKQDRIIEAAGREFADHGYERASLNAIIESAGISKGAFYYYFDDKADLFATILQRVRQDIFEPETFDPSKLTADNFWQAVEDLTQRSLDYNERHPWMPRLSRNLNRHADEFGAPLQHFLEEAQQATRRYVQRGRALGVIRDDVPEGLMLAMITALDRAVDHWFSEAWEDMGADRAAEISHAIVDMFRGMCEPR